jgi:hypothetical protein
MSSSADGHDTSTASDDNDSTSAASDNNDASRAASNDNDARRAASNDNDSRHAASDDNDPYPCRRHYEDSGNNKKVLFLMSIGLTHNDAPLISFEMVPWSLLPKTTMRPKNTDYGLEVERRATLYNILPSPRPRNWSRKATIEWLELNPVRGDRDIEFLRLEVSRVRDVLQRAQATPTSTDGELNSGSVAGRGMWRGAVPYLRAILTLTEDHVKALFLTRARVRTRQEIDARNSDIR